jgi:hypothetical protein
MRGYPVKRAVLAIFAWATFVSAPPATAEDLSGWPDAKWGMTPDEVQKAVGYPTSFADLVQVCQENCAEGAVLELSDYELNGQHFLVRFWFTKAEARLHTVSMYAKSMYAKQLDRADDHAAFAKMKSYLDGLYGSPKFNSLKNGFFVVKWVLPSTEITLHSDAATKTTVVYAERPKKESKGS